MILFSWIWLIYAKNQLSFDRYIETAEMWYIFQEIYTLYALRCALLSIGTALFTHIFQDNFLLRVQEIKSEVYGE